MIKIRLRKGEKKKKALADGEEYLRTIKKNTRTKARRLVGREGGKGAVANHGIVREG